MPWSLIEHNASGFDLVSTAVLSPEGTLQVTARFGVILGYGEVIGYQCTLIEARLNGGLVTDPARARRLSARAGIPEPPLLTWIRDSSPAEAPQGPGGGEEARELPELRWAPYQEFGIPDPAAETSEPPPGPFTVGVTGYRGSVIIVYWKAHQPPEAE